MTAEAVLVFARPGDSHIPDRQANTTYPPGRRCVHHALDGRCITRLNQFNPGPYCLCHAREHEVERLEAEAA